MDIKHFPEPVLVRRLSEGNEEGFREVFNRFHRKIYQFAFSFLKDKAHSEEIVQDTFLNFWLHREHLDPNAPIAPLLFTIARRILVDAWRKAASSENFRKKLINMLELSTNDTEDRLFAVELERITQDAMNQLNEQQ